MSGKEDSSADAATTQQEQTTPKEGESKSNTESKPENTAQVCLWPVLLRYFIFSYICIFGVIQLALWLIA